MEVDSYTCGIDDGLSHLCGRVKTVQTGDSELESCEIRVAFFCAVSLRNYLDSVLMRSVCGQLWSVLIERNLLAASNRLVQCKRFSF